MKTWFQAFAFKCSLCRYTEDTPWEGGTFKLNLTFSEDYPNKAPVVKFESRMFHPNIYNDGGICLDILQNQWWGGTSRMQLTQA